MGWLEFRAWLRAMNHQKHGRPSDPDTWEGADQDQGWAELRAARDRARGRA